MTSHTTRRRTYFFYDLLSQKVEEWKSRCTKLMQTEPNHVGHIKLIYTVAVGCWPYIDMLLDFSVAWDYYSKELYLFVGLTLAFILIGKFASIVLTLNRTGLKEGESKWSFIVKYLFTKRWKSLRHVYKHGSACRAATKKGDQPVQVNEYNLMLNETQELASLSYLVTFAESLPQTILQSFLVVQEITSSPSKLAEHVLPILKIVVGSAFLGNSLKSGYENELFDDGHFLEGAQAYALTIRNTLFIFSRILTISLLALSSWIILLVGILVHWTLYSAYYFISFFNEVKRENISTSFLHGFFLVAFFKRITFTSLSKHDATIYFAVYAVENIASVFYWSSMNQQASLQTFLVYLCTGSSILGLLVHFVYIFTLFPPKHYPSLLVSFSEKVNTKLTFNAPDIMPALQQLANTFTITNIQRFRLHDLLLVLYAKDVDTFAKLHTKISQIRLLEGKNVEILTDKHKRTNIKISICLWGINQRTVTEVMRIFQKENTDYDVQSWQLVGHRTTTRKMMTYFIVDEKTLIDIKGKKSLIKYPLARIEIDFTPCSIEFAYKEHWLKVLREEKRQFILDFRYGWDKKIVGKRKIVSTIDKTPLEVSNKTIAGSEEVLTPMTNVDEISVTVEFTGENEEMTIERVAEVWRYLSIGIFSKRRVKPESIICKDGSIVMKMADEKCLKNSFFLREPLWQRQPITLTNLQYNGHSFFFAIVSSDGKTVVTSNTIRTLIERSNCNLYRNELIQEKWQYDYSTFLFGVEDDLLITIEKNGLILPEEWSARVAVYSFQSSNPMNMLEIDVYITEALLHYHSVHTYHPSPIQSTNINRNLFNQWNITGETQKKQKEKLSDLCIFIKAATNVPQIREKLSHHFGSNHVAIATESSIHVFPKNIKAKQIILKLLLAYLPLEYEVKISHLIYTGMVNVHVTVPDTFPPLQSKVTFLSNLKTANPGLRIEEWLLISSQRVNEKDTYGFYLNDECLWRLYNRKLKCIGSLIEPIISNSVIESLQNSEEHRDFGLTVSSNLGSISNELFTEINNSIQNGRNFDECEKITVDRLKYNVRISTNLKFLSDWALNVIMERQNNPADLLKIIGSFKYESMVNTILVVPTDAHRLSARQILKEIGNFYTSEWFLISHEQRELFDVLKLYINNNVLETILNEPSQIQYKQQFLVPVIETTASLGYLKFEGSFFSSTKLKHKHFKEVTMYDVVFEYQKFCNSMNISAVVSFKEEHRRLDIACNDRVGLECFMNKAPCDNAWIKVVYDSNLRRVRNHKAANVMLAIDSSVQSVDFFRALEVQIPTVDFKENWVYYENYSGKHELGFHFNDTLLLEFCNIEAQSYLKVDDKPIEATLLHNVKNKSILTKDESLTLIIYHGEQCFSSCTQALEQLCEVPSNSFTPYSNSYRYLRVSNSKEDNKCLIYCLSKKYLDIAFDWLTINKQGGLKQCVIVKTFGIPDVNVELSVPLELFSRPSDIISEMHCKYPELQCDSWHVISCKKQITKRVFGFKVDLTQNIFYILQENKNFNLSFNDLTLNVSMHKNCPISNRVLKMLCLNFEADENDVSQSRKFLNNYEENESFVSVIEGQSQNK